MDFLRLNRRCCGISPPVLAFPTNSCPVITGRSVIHARASANESALFYGAAKIYCGPAGHADVFPAGWKRLFCGGLFCLPRARFDFYQARSSRSRAEWIGDGRMAIDGPGRSVNR